ncbi:MAG: NADH-quinone oxidoreductase subunit NuoE [Alphaproteobacteria bacterium]|nr:NADH-quinone oxidoreductase subunit NuoE [Alphaproteobacteria bacterium]
MSAQEAANVPQPASFEFTPENLERAKKIIAKYPTGKQQSAVMPLLDLAQRQHDNWLPIAAMEYVARLLDMAPIRVREVATFYTMYNHAPIGRHHVQICTTTPCWLRGSDTVVDACEKRLGIKLGETTADRQFTLAEAECLGACVNAPMMQVGDDYYEDLTPETTVNVLDALARGEKPKPGNQSKRLTSSPEGGFTTLLDTAKGSD